MLPRSVSAAFVMTAALSIGSSARAEPASPQAQYQAQRAACMSGKSNEDQATCLKEAGAALEEAKRGHLNDADANYRKNEMERCKALTGDDQRDCFARMKGGGTVSGSVGGGGILREKTTKEVVSPARVVTPAAAGSAPG